MIKQVGTITFVFGLFILATSGLFAQDGYVEPVYPPVLQPGPFPFGTEPVRDDAPVDVTDPNDVIHEYTAYKGTVVVDGDLSDSAWVAIPWTFMEFNRDWQSSTEGSLWDEAYEPGGYDGWEDLSSWFKIIHDDENIYVAVMRYDDDFNYDPTTTDNPGNIWQNDAYQIIIDTRLPGDFEMESPGAEVGISYVDELEVYNWWSTTYQNPPEQLQLAEGNCASGLASTDGKAIIGSLDESGDLIVEKMEVAFVKFDVMIEGDEGMLSICALDRDYDTNESVNQWAQGLFVKTSEEYGSVYWSPETAVSKTSVRSREKAAPEAFVLNQNHPNPFNPSTTISYSLTSREHVTLKVFSVNGQEVTTLLDGVQNSGQYDVTFDASDIPSGIYVYKMQAGGQTFTRKMSLIK
ncbi:T9SS type A sorting domain-containing protein [candidate division KSB1 bacterium]|nr:T9SS type A sorting domain-containing protein [candidate division KSB1 bacterium]